MHVFFQHFIVSVILAFAGSAVRFHVAMVGHRYRPSQVVELMHHPRTVIVCYFVFRCWFRSYKGFGHKNVRGYLLLTSVTIT